jgi:outer membrane protein
MRQKQKLICLAVFLILACGEPGRAVTDDEGPAQGTGARATLRLSMKQAVDLALSPEGSTRVQLAEELIKQSKARSAQARASLLPNVDGAIAYQSQTRNLAAAGIRIQLPVPGFVFPSFVGPFTVFDARATATQSVFDLSSIRRFQASRAGIGLAEAEKENAGDQVRDAVARSYLACLRTKATLETVQANIQLAGTLVKLAEDQKSAGTGTGIEITRARVQLANEKQRLLVAENEHRRSQLQLLRVMGLDLDATVELTDGLELAPAPSLTIDEAIRIAMDSRADWKVQQKRNQSAELNASATKMERVPTLHVFGDYGSSGDAIDNSLPTRTVGFAVRVPIFDGGRRDARRAEAGSQLRQEIVRQRDLRAQIELEIRTALDSIRSATEQTRTAEEGLSLAESELAQAKRRYQSGVGTSIEVTDAQTRLERARENRVAALFNYNLARIDLSSATGTIQQVIP